MVYCMSSDPTTIQVFYTKERRGHLTVRTGEEVLDWNEELEDIDRNDAHVTIIWWHRPGYGRVTMATTPKLRLQGCVLSCQGCKRVRQMAERGSWGLNMYESLH